mmetsp:Transcript_47849/g.147910  ORF Transcript_47849/g.147910 Transcript_47849/m.147910 type:complete len:392 (+) Transcript_47849:433-1608(+)
MDPVLKAHLAELLELRRVLLCGNGRLRWPHAQGPQALEDGHELLAADLPQLGLAPRRCRGRAHSAFQPAVERLVRALLRRGPGAAAGCCRGRGGSGRARLCPRPPLRSIQRVDAVGGRGGLAPEVLQEEGLLPRKAQTAQPLPGLRRPQLPAVARPLLHHAELARPHARARLGLHPVQDLAQRLLPQEATLQAAAVGQPQEQLHRVGAGRRLGPQRRGLLGRPRKALVLALLGLSGQGLLPRLALLLRALLRLRLLAREDLDREVRVQQREVRLRLQRADHELVGRAAVPDREPVALGQRRVAAERLLQHVLQVQADHARAAGVEALAARLQPRQAPGAAREPEVPHLDLAHRGQRVEAGPLGEAECHARWDAHSALLGGELRDPSMRSAE